VDEHDWATAWVAGLDKVELYATAACDSVVLHLHLRSWRWPRSRAPFSLILTSHALKAGIKIAAPDAAKTLANTFRT
jgi:hypothetical protein